VNSIKEKIQEVLRKTEKIPGVKLLLTPRIRKIFSWSVFGFLLLVLIFFLFPLLPIENNYSLKMVLSGSMEPTIKTGGVVMVKPTSEYQIGDVITYQYGHYSRNLTTHRIIGKTEEGFITQGDNNNAADLHPVEREQIKGKVLLTIPYVGYVANFARSRAGLALLVFIPALFIIGNESRKILREVRKKNQKKEKSDKKIETFCLLLLLVSLSAFTSIGGGVYCHFNNSVAVNNNRFQAGYWVPVLDSIGDKTIPAGSLLEFPISATDPNGDSLTYSASGLPKGATFNENFQKFSWSTGYNQNGTYNVRFKVTDGTYVDSEEITITVTEMPLPTISNITEADVSSNSVRITWETDQLATSKVEYGSDSSYGVTEEETSYVSNHSLTLNSLSPSTTYHYQVSSKNKAEKKAFSEDCSFTTLTSSGG
jgi:signal peptidase I